MIKVMKVAFNARTLSAPQLRGWSRYASNLLRELSHAGVQIYLFSDRKLNEELLKDCSKKNLEVIVKRGFLYLDWEQRVLPSLCEEYNIDILHCPINYGLPIRRNWKQVLTLHDAIEKAFYDQFKSLLEKMSFEHLYIRGLHKLSQACSDKIITVSHHAASDLQKYYGVSPKKVEVIYEAADPIFNQSVNKEGIDLKTKFNIGEEYLFYVGGLEKRKNIEFLFQAIAQSVHKPMLVVAGGGVEIDFFRKLSTQLGISQRVKFLGWVEDKDLPSLYHHARAFVYPSLYEGFGLQLVEAMAQSCPVLCANVTSLPEIWGTDEGTFDPTNIKSLASLVDRVMVDESYYNKLKEWSSERHKDFSWSKTAQKTIDLYRSLLESQSETTP